MEENFKLEQIDRDDVLEFSFGSYRIAKAIDTIKNVFLSDVCTNFSGWLNRKNIRIDPLDDSKQIDPTTWFDRGIDCELLKVGAKGWQKGKIRLKVSLEFIPDETIDDRQTSELDDIRELMT
jgi:KGK domain